MQKNNSKEIKLNFLMRRAFLHKATILAGSAATLGWPRHLLAQMPPVQTTLLSAGVLLVSGPDGNVLVVDSNAGLLLVDGGHADWFDSLHAAIAVNFPGKSIRALFNTQWHLEQTGSNLALGKQGVEIIAHENTKLWLSTEIWQRWSDITFPALAKSALPTTTFYDDGAIQLGNRYVQYGYLRSAHTDGDIWVYFEDENVLVTGGLVSNGRWPEIDWWTGGYIGGVLDSFVALLTVPDENTKIIPAFGNIMTLQELQAQNQMYLTIFDRLHGLYINSASLDEILAAKPTAEYDAVMGDPTLFLTLAFQSLQGHLRDPQNFRLLNIP